MRNTTALCAGQGWGQMGIGFLHDLLLPSHVAGRGANVWERRRWLSPEALDFLDGLLRYAHQVGTGVLTLELRVVVCVRRGGGGGSHFQAPAEVGAQYITSWGGGFSLSRSWWALLILGGKRGEGLHAQNECKIMHKRLACYVQAC
jgi:hypothetical protein